MTRFIFLIQDLCLHKNFDQLHCWVRLSPKDRVLAIVLGSVAESMRVGNLGPTDFITMIFPTVSERYICKFHVYSLHIMKKSNKPKD